MIVSRPVKKVQIEVVLQVGCVKYFIWFFADLAHLFFGIIALSSELLFMAVIAILLILLRGLLFASEAHDFVGNFGLVWLENALA
jgi:hypothetical protein